MSSEGAGGSTPWRRSWGARREVVVTPGNPGIPGSVPAPPEEIDADLFVIGPEVPLVDGLADRLRAAGRLVFGPGADGARLEGSKAWMKQVLADAGVPTARHGVFTDGRAGRRLPPDAAPPYVVKTDGLAAGKGVLVTDVARRGRRRRGRPSCRASAFGDAGRRVVIEEGLAGPELSLLCVCDGRRAVPLAPAQDFKRLGDGDAGPNTGGMGAYSPVPGAGKDLVDEVLERAVEPTLAALRRQGIDYRGVLYAGLMLTPDGPKVLEYNVRFGDPEAQVVLPRLRRRPGRPAGRGRRRPTCVSEPAVRRRRRRHRRAGRRGLPARRPAPATPIDGHRRRPRPCRASTVFCAGVGPGRQRRLVTAGGRVLTSPPSAPTWPTARPPGLRTAVGRRSRWPAACSIARRHRRPEAAHGDPDEEAPVKVAVLMGSARRQGQDGARGGDPGRVRHRGRRAGAVRPPHARRGGRLRPRRPGRRLRRLHLRGGHGGPPGRGGGGQHHPAVVGVPLSAAAPSTASTPSTPPSRCPGASRWPPSPSTGP